MTVYLDASFLVALFTNDPHTARAEAYLRSAAPIVAVSDFGAAEFSSAIARRVRMRDLREEDALAAFLAVDEWIARAAQRLETRPGDVMLAASFLRRLDLVLRTPDALNIAITQRAGASLATFDTRMADAARALGLAVVP